MTFINLGEWLPDQPEFQNPGSSVITNVLPRTPQSYGPIQGLMNVFNALSARCQGAIGVRDSAGNAYLFAGDGTKLYEITSGAATFSDVSKMGGYTCPSDAFWSFAQFGDIFCASEISDNIQTFTLASSSVFADLSASAPRAAFLGTVRNFLVAGRTVDGTDGSRPQRLWWPAIDDPTNWPTVGTSAAAAVQSDLQDVEGSQGWLTGIAPLIGPVDAAIMFEKAVFRMMYVGAPVIFSILPAVGVRGCKAAGSLQVTEVGAIYLSDQGIELFNGNIAIPIGEQKINKWLKATLDPANIPRVISAIDPVNKYYFLAFPSTAAINGNPDMLICCNYELTSTVGTPGRFSLVTGLTLEYLFNSVSFGYTMETLDTVTTDLDLLPITLDSQAWTGNGTVLTAFDTTHTPGYFGGATLAATCETSEAQLFAGHRALVTGAFPITDGGAPTIAVGTRDRTMDAVTYSTPEAVQDNGLCPIFAEGRYHRFQLNQPAGAAFDHMQGVDIPKECAADTGIV